MTDISTIDDDDFQVAIEKYLSDNPPRTNAALRFEIASLRAELDKAVANNDVALATAYQCGYDAGEERGMRMQRERDAVIARSFNATPAFDLPCSPYDRTESIAEAIERTPPHKPRRC